MLPAILGKKIGMTQIFDENGAAIPVTLIEAGPCFVTQVRFPQNDGYSAVQLGFEEVKPKRITGGQIGLMGIVLLLLLFAWVRLAALLFMLFFGLEPPSLPRLFAQTFFNPDALPFLIVGTVIGAVLAALAFTISAVGFMSARSPRFTIPRVSLLSGR